MKKLLVTSFIVSKIAKKFLKFYNYFEKSIQKISIEKVKKIFIQGKDNLVLPLVIMGFISMVGGITGLRLPETLHQRLPQTIEEGENFGKDWSWWSCCGSSHVK